MDKNRLKALAILVIISILLFFIGFLVKRINVSDQVSLKMIGTPVSDVGNNVREKELVNKNENTLPVTNIPSSNEAMSYSDFVKMYSEKRIQFDEQCRATPSTASFSVGEFIILDNRSDKLQAVRFIDDLYALPPLHVRVFELKRQGIFDIDCGSSKNVAKVIVH